MCQLKNSFPVVKAPSGAPEVTAEGLPIKQWRKIRGFDEAADLDQDGYLTGKEYNRLNKDATARFRWESRVIPFGRMWSQRSSWALTDLTNPNYVQAISDYYEHNWSEQGLNSAYNDDTNKLLGPNQFTVFSGGTITELDLVAGSQAVDDLYKTQFSVFLRQLAQRQPDALIGLNIGTANLYGRNGQVNWLMRGRCTYVNITSFHPQGCLVMLVSISFGITRHWPAQDKTSFFKQPLAMDELGILAILKRIGKQTNALLWRCSI